MAHRSTLTAMAATAVLVPALTRGHHRELGQDDLEPRTLRDPAALPRPVLWPVPKPGQQPSGDPTGKAGHLGVSGEPQARGPAWVAVGLMILSTCLGTLALIAKGWPWWVAAGIVGLAGALLAWKAQIMQDATQGQSPEDK